MTLAQSNLGITIYRDVRGVETGMDYGIYRGTRYIKIRLSFIIQYSCRGINILPGISRFKVYRVTVYRGFTVLSNAHFETVLFSRF